MPSAQAGTGWQRSSSEFRRLLAALHRSPDPGFNQERVVVVAGRMLNLFGFYLHTPQTHPSYAPLLHRTSQWYTVYSQ